MVERAGLENRCRCKPTVGSNPTSSANVQFCIRTTQSLPDLRQARASSKMG